VVTAAGAHGLPATDIRAVDAFIDAPRALFGRTRVGVESALGAPSAIRARTLADDRRSSTDPVDELEYPGVVIGVSRRSAGLRRVEITEARWTLPGGLNVGAPRSLIEQRLGEPQATTDLSGSTCTPTPIRTPWSSTSAPAGCTGSSGCTRPATRLVPEPEACDPALMTWRPSIARAVS
jgi:hypothetical protein